jgi:dTDP-4-amino-4,6-dideoxygalactose transaminase
VDTGSSFLPSELTAAFLYAQLENIEVIQKKRLELWTMYYDVLRPLETDGRIALPQIPEYATNNAHMFYILCSSEAERSDLIAWLKKHEVLAVSHYISLHSSPYYQSKHDGRDLPNSDRFTRQLLRLPMYFELSVSDAERVSSLITAFYRSK